MHIIGHQNLSFRISTVLVVACLSWGALVAGQTSTPSATGASTSDWKQVEAAMGRPGQIQPGDVIKFGMPRKDLHIVLDGVDIKPAWR